jgi:hypothetical protein
VGLEIAVVAPVYRLPASAKRGKLSVRRREIDGTAVAALLLLGLVSFVRVVGAVVRHEVFGAESTLALLCLLAIPWLAWPGSPAHACRSIRRRTTNGRGSKNRRFH